MLVFPCNGIEMSHFIKHSFQNNETLFLQGIIGRHRVCCLFPVPHQTTCRTISKTNDCFPTQRPPMKGHKDRYSRWSLVSIENCSRVILYLLSLVVEDSLEI